LLNDELQILEEVAYAGSTDSSADFRLLEEEITREAFLTKQVSKLEISLKAQGINHAEKALGARWRACQFCTIKIVSGSSITASGGKEFRSEPFAFLKSCADCFATGIVIHRIYHQMTHSETQRLMLGRFFFRLKSKGEESSAQREFATGRRATEGNHSICRLEGFSLPCLEKIDHEKVVEILNSYFSLMTPIIFQHMVRSNQNCWETG